MRTLLCFAVGALLFASATVAEPCVGDREVGHAVWVENEVVWRATGGLGGWAPIERRDSLGVGCTLQSGSDSGLVMNIFRGGMLTLGAHSDVDIREDQLQPPDPEACPLITTDKAKMRLTIQPGYQVVSCRIETPDATVISVTTDFGIWTHPRVGTLVVVLEGHVRLELADGETLEVAAGHRVLVRGHEVWQDREVDAVLPVPETFLEEIQIVDPPALPERFNLIGR